MQYSKKKNPSSKKFIRRRNKSQENSTTVMKQTAGETINPSDILQIYHILGEQGRIRPVIAPETVIQKLKYSNTDQKMM